MSDLPPRNIMIMRHSDDVWDALMIEVVKAYVSGELRDQDDWVESVDITKTSELLDDQNLGSYYAGQINDMLSCLVFNERNIDDPF